MAQAFGAKKTGADWFKFALGFDSSGFLTAQNKAAETGKSVLKPRRCWPSDLRTPNYAEWGFFRLMPK